MVEFTEPEESDYNEILNLYNYYILHSTATFHTQPVSLSNLKKMLPLGQELYKTFVIKQAGIFCGYCYINHFKPRQAYKRSAEITTYIHPDYKRKGLGKKALIFLENYAQKNALKNLLGVITLENKPSIRLFEKQGYVLAGHLKNVGEKFNRVLDVVTYQKQLQ